MQYYTLEGICFWYSITAAIDTITASKLLHGQRKRQWQREFLINNYVSQALRWSFKKLLSFSKFIFFLQRKIQYEHKLSTIRREYKCHRITSNLHLRKTCSIKITCETACCSISAAHLYCHHSQSVLQVWFIYRFFLHLRCRVLIKIKIL